MIGLAKDGKLSLSDRGFSEILSRRIFCWDSRAKWHADRPTAVRIISSMRHSHMLREIRIEPRHDPAHAWAEYAVACITHLKVEPEKLKRHPIQPNAGPAVRLEVIALDDKLISKILVSPLPDLKASDMLYFLIARHGNLTLVTEDRRLRNVSMNGGVRALSLKSALAHIREENE